MKQTIENTTQWLEYKKVIYEIKNLNRKILNKEDLKRLMYLSYISAIEFREALIIALKFANKTNFSEELKIWLREMSEWELGTNNLSYDWYNQKADHYQFLEYFIKKYNFEIDEELVKAGKKYQEKCKKFNDEERAMSIFSREQELSWIFEEILKASNRKEEPLWAFNYYLKKHIELDSGNWWHWDLIGQFPIDDKVKSFFETRLELYKAIPKLFKKKKELQNSKSDTYEILKNK